MTAPKVVVFGTAGYALVHLRRARVLHDDGEIVLAGACDVRDPSPESADLLPPGAVLTPSIEELLRQAEPDIAVIATPPHTHLDAALAAVDAGCQVLLEKPPVLDLAAFDLLSERASAAGVECQVGFQSFGSAALTVLREAVEAGAVGEPRGVGTAGAWIRRDSYYRRNGWAGRRVLDGKSVVDGSLTNPFAHAVATATLVAGTAGLRPRRIDVELHRARPIEADDTACARLTFDNGVDVVAAATLCADQVFEPYVVLHGAEGAARWWYRSDRLEINGETMRAGPPTDLLRNLVRHVEEGTPLAAPLNQTRAFTAFVEAVRDHPGPKAIAPEWVDLADEGPEQRYVVRHVEKFVESAAEELALFSELGVPWVT
ncbi:Gfo/Idh/MocA family protein [Amycolatopsis orientalis]|uniref:Gfo/Idh/MocA family protein n=1 Tax=Amycolatopsis orientalis TaxID=31958 RepID=UPI0004066654|nr:Gfo/Idh/MocA family oxidoreductase [Amycolatopsis orientalis]